MRNDTTLHRQTRPIPVCLLDGRRRHGARLSLIRRLSWLRLAEVFLEDVETLHDAGLRLAAICDSLDTTSEALFTRLRRWNRADLADAIGAREADRDPVYAISRLGGLALRNRRSAA